MDEGDKEQEFKILKGRIVNYMFCPLDLSHFPNFCCFKCCFDVEYSDLRMV